MMKKQLLILSFLIGLLVGCAREEQSSLQTLEAKASYILGFQNAQDMRELNIDSTAYINGFNDASGQINSRIPTDDIESILLEYQQKLIEGVMQKNEKEGQQFLSEYAKKEGVIAEKSGVFYRILQTGDGEVAGSTDVVKVHYEGRLVDDTVFDSSYQRGEPAELPVNGVIQGWTNILQIMPVGSIWEVAIPPQLAYGESGAGQVIGPNSVLIFKIELLEIVR